MSPRDRAAEPRVVFSCVSENRPEWYHKVRNLVVSVRLFGGTLADSAIVVNFVDAVDRGVAEQLEALGAQIRIVHRFDPRTPYANKLRVLELAAELDAELIVGLDCDVVVVGDLRPQLSGTEVAAKPADIDRLTDVQWRALFQELRVPMPSRSVIATTTGRPMYPYFNSGVVSVPATLAGRLLNSWATTLDELFELFSRNPSVVPPEWRFHADQFALACALARDGFPVRPLPVSFNFPTHVPVHPAALRDAPSPLILHYHRDITPEGFLRRSRMVGLNPLIDHFNARRAEFLGVPYAGLPGPSLHERARGAVRHGWRRFNRIHTAIGSAAQGRGVRG